MRPIPKENAMLRFLVGRLLDWIDPQPEPPIHIPKFEWPVESARESSQDAVNCGPYVVAPSAETKPELVD